jgi:methyl-accepting chemotaxis protein
MDKASESILALKPVSFRYKVHKDATPQFGLIAEQVAEVNPDLVVHDENGDIYTVRYDAVNAMLLNEFLKAHRKIEDQQATIADLRSTVAQEGRELQATIAQLTERLDEQAAQIQKVSVQLEANKPAPKMVNNP